MRFTLIPTLAMLALAACDPGDPNDFGDLSSKRASGPAEVRAAERSATNGSAGDGSVADSFIAEGLPSEGPGESAGVTSSEMLGALRLSDEFPAMEGWVMRARVVTVAPDAQIAVHGHGSRPGVAYVLEGELIEHRNDDPPALRRVGDAVFENTGTVHWWENATARPARVMAVDIIPGDS